MQQEIRLIGTPYAFGIREVEMGLAAGALFAADQLPQKLNDRGIHSEISMINTDASSELTLQLPAGDQMSNYLLQNYALREYVAEAREKGQFPLMSSGNCNTSLGVVGGLNDDGIGMIWFDAHADASTPETSVSGFFDGMPVAIINGQCWKPLRESISGFHTIPTDRIVSVGMHDLQEGRPGPIGDWVSRERADQVGSWKEAFNQAMEALAQHTDRVYLHIDTDVLDNKVVAVNKFADAAVGGLSLEEMESSIDSVFEHFTVLASSFTAFDPSHDPRGVPTISQLMERVATLAVKQ